MLTLPGDVQFDAVLVDYVHKRKFPTLGPLFTWTLRLTSLAVGVGVYQFNTNDIGAYLYMPVCTLLTKLFDSRFGRAHPPRMDCIGLNEWEHLFLSFACTRTNESSK